MSKHDKKKDKNPARETDSRKVSSVYTAPDGKDVRVRVWPGDDATPSDATRVLDALRPVLDQLDGFAKIKVDRKPSGKSWFPNRSKQESDAVVPPFSKKEQVMSEEIKRSVPEYAEVSADARKALDPHIAGAQVIEAHTKQAHGVVATTVVYVRDGKAHEIAWDQTTRKLLAGDEPGVIEGVIGALPESGQRAVREGGQTIHKIKIKHDEKDDHEYVHVHYLAEDGQIISRKLELDGSEKDQGQNPSQETERVIPDYAQVSAEARKAFDPHVAGAQISGIVQAAAHGVVETAVTYLRDGDLHEIVYDETTSKLLGGSEPGSIEAVIAGLPESGQRRVREGGQTIRKIKIKHDEKDDREYVHVHYVDADGLLTSRKLELDGNDKRKQAA